MSAFVYIVLSYLVKDTAMFQAQKNEWELYAANQKELLDRESESEALPVETDSHIRQRDCEKEFGKTTGVITVTW